MLGTDGDKVTTIDVAQRSCRIAEYGDGVGIDFVATYGHITAGKHCITDDDAVVVKCLPLQLIVFIFLAF